MLVAVPGKSSHLRGIDDNTLLRLYDQTKASLAVGHTPHERERLLHTLSRIAHELSRRGLKA